MPSLHSAFSALVAMFLWAASARALRPLLVLYPLAMGVTLIATGEHYFFDVLLGWLYAGGGDGRLGLVGAAAQRRAGRGCPRACAAHRAGTAEDRSRVTPDPTATVARSSKPLSIGIVGGPIAVRLYRHPVTADGRAGAHILAR